MFLEEFKQICLQFWEKEWLFGYGFFVNISLSCYNFLRKINFAHAEQITKFI